jgi:hypothetical protein
VSLAFGSYGRPSADELTLFHSRNTTDGGGFGASYVDILVASRASLTDPFVYAGPLPGNVNTAGYEARATTSADLLFMIYETAPPGVVPGPPDGGPFLAAASRTGASDWMAAGPVPELSSGLGEGSPYLLPNGSAVYFHSFRTGGGDLYRAARKQDGAFDAPAKVMGAELDTAASEVGPVVTPDELTLYFGSTRPPQNGGPELAYPDLFVARRARIEDPFGPPVPVSELNSPVYEIPTWISSDECVLYFVQGDVLAVGSAAPKVKVATRPK